MYKFGLFRDPFIDCSRSNFKHQKSELWGEKPRELALSASWCFNI